MNISTNDTHTAKTEVGYLDFQGGMKLDGMGYAREHVLLLNIDNLFDKTYMASAHDYGVRPNKPQTFMAGISVRFLRKINFISFSDDMNESGWIPCSQTSD